MVILCIALYIVGGFVTQTRSNLLENECLQTLDSDPVLVCAWIIQRLSTQFIYLKKNAVYIQSK